MCHFDLCLLVFVHFLAFCRKQDVGLSSSFPVPQWHRLFLQGALVSFPGEWYLEINIWVLLGVMVSSHLQGAEPGSAFFINPEFILILSNLTLIFLTFSWFIFVSALNHGENFGFE